MFVARSIVSSSWLHYLPAHHHTPSIPDPPARFLSPGAGRRSSLQSRTMSNAAPLTLVSGFDTSAVTYSGTWAVHAQVHIAVNDVSSTNPANVTLAFRGVPISSAIFTRPRAQCHCFDPGTQASAFGPANLRGAPLQGEVTDSGTVISTQILVPTNQTAPLGTFPKIASTERLPCGAHNFTLVLGAQQTLRIANFMFAPCLVDSATVEPSPGAGGAGAGNETGVDAGVGAGTDPGSGPPGREHFGALDVGLVVLAAVSVLALLVMAAILLVRERRRRRRLREADPAEVAPANAPPAAESHKLERRAQLAVWPFQTPTSIVPAPARVGSEAATGRSPVLDISLDSEHRAASSAGAATRFSRSTVELPLLPPPVTESKSEKGRKWF
ncbi:hypothetical protein BC834DRAFT_142998 [Gloeopeniophorella convolvens]|nr:hypothetical protein BC834DRAFT_142998 [Gloeopeniophorella convolvens]